MNMKKQRSFSSFLGLTVLLVAVPHAVQAQTAVPKSETPKQVQVAVDYVDVTPAIYHKASHQLPAGQDQDALLLAALIKSGAKDTQAPRVETVDNVSANMDMATTIPITANGKAGSLSLHNFVEVKPHFNIDGTITVTLKMHRDVLTPGVTPPTTTTTDFSTTRTFQDGQTLVLGELVSKTPLMAHLVFARVMSTPAP